MKSFIKKNWRLCFILYVAIYLPWFFFLEKIITPTTPGVHIIHNFLDDYIPFCEYFIIPYFIWFFYIAISCVYMFFKGTNKEYLKFALSLVVGMSLCLIVCMIYKNGLNLRPEVFPRDNIFTDMVARLYLTDTSTNVFPSIHVYNSLAMHIALVKTEALSEKRFLRLASLITCISICASTVFLKQHSVIDVLGGGILMVIMYIALYVIDYNKLPFIQKETEDLEILE